MNKEIQVGSKIRYASAAGILEGVVRSIKVGPTAKPGFMNTWMTIDLPVQPKVRFATAVQIPANDLSLKMYRVEVIG